MLRLMKILLCDKLFYFLLLIVLFYSFIYLSFYKVESNYRINDKNFKLIIKNYNIDGNKLTLYFYNLKGIYYFEDALELGLKPGMPGLEALNLGDPVLELGITPDRGDLLSMIGVAYEFSASFGRPMKPLAYSLVRDAISKDEKLSIKIETEGCVGYYGQLIKNAKMNNEIV